MGMIMDCTFLEAVGKNVVCYKHDHCVYIPQGSGTNTSTPPCKSL